MTKQRRSSDGKHGSTRDRFGCSLHFPWSVAPSAEAVGRLEETARAVADGAFGSVEIVQSPDPQTKEPMWIGVVWLRCGEADGAGLRRQVLRAVHERYPGEWFGRLVVEVRALDESA
jgi:hypothetical protein